MKSYASIALIYLGLSVQLWCSSDIEVCCSHNDRDGVSVADVIEHIGNLDFGSAGRDVIDVISGYEELAGLNQPLQKEEEN